MESLDPFNVVHSQYKLLSERLDSTSSAKEVGILFKRLVNLIAVMEFLISLNNVT
jgi:hypothetical protein